MTPQELMERVCFNEAFKRLGAIVCIGGQHAGQYRMTGTDGQDVYVNAKDIAGLATMPCFRQMLGVPCQPSVLDT